ncbi:MAG: Na+/H+ antiporter NhaC family protein [Pseudomonadales bacterium]|nr:Na+/H+ antiporter NhaC family protein [Pseudomonadales bacterium]
MHWLSLIPPLLAILVTIWKRQVIPALLLAIFAAEVLLHGFNPLLGLTAGLDRIVQVFSNASNTEILLFSLLIGALLNLLKQSGGVSAFVHYLLKTGIAASPRSVSLLTSALGLIIFIESNLSILASGIFARGLFDRFHLSRARLAFIIDSTCSPVSVLILLNGWGAYILGLLNGYGLDNPLTVMLGSIPLNFYAIIILGMTVYTSWSTRVFFTLSTHELSLGTIAPPEDEDRHGKIHYFLLPLLTLVLGIVLFMYYTGSGELIRGSGSSSVLYATVVAILLLWYLLIRNRMFSGKQLLEESFRGMAELLPVVAIVLLALALGSSMQALGTGEFVAGMISQTLPFWLLAPVVFLTAAIISFSTGTSWGTFALLLPVAIPIALSSALPPPLLLAAVLSGGVFGDHCSPISDSTILASLASGCDHLDHVRTQLPYALLAAGLSLPLFILFSFQNAG